MKPTNENVDKWEQQARILLAPIADRKVEAKPQLTDRILGQVHASICTCGIVELATTVFVKEHIGSTAGALVSLFVPDTERRFTHE